MNSNISLAIIIENPTSTIQSYKTMSNYLSATPFLFTLWLAKTAGQKHSLKHDVCLYCKGKCAKWVYVRVCRLRAFHRFICEMGSIVLWAKNAISVSCIKKYFGKILRTVFRGYRTNLSRLLLRWGGKNETVLWHCATIGLLEQNSVVIWLG